MPLPGACQYHFWMRGMQLLSRRNDTQHLHRKSERYRNPVRRRRSAYHLHIQVGLIAQGLLHYLAVKHPREVWVSFGSWLLPHIDPELSGPLRLAG